MSFIVDHITDAVALVGLALIVVGLGMIFLPLAYLGAGAALVAIGVIGARRQ